MFIHRICCAPGWPRDQTGKLKSRGETTGGWTGQWTPEMVSKVNRVLESSRTNLKIMITMFYKSVENTEKFNRKLRSIMRQCTANEEVGVLI